MPKFDITKGSRPIPSFPIPTSEQGPDAPQPTVFKFVLAHEITHALVLGDINNDILTDFQARFLSPESIVFDECRQLEIYKRSEGKGIEAGLSGTEAQNKDDEERLADFIASYLYAPNLLGNTQTAFHNWVTGEGGGGLPAILDSPQP